MQVAHLLAKINFLTFQTFNVYNYVINVRIPMKAQENLSIHTRYSGISAWLRDRMAKPHTSSVSLSQKLGYSQGQISDWRNKGMSYIKAQEVAAQMGWTLPPLENLVDLVGETDEETIPLTSAAASMGYGLLADEYEVISNVRVSRGWLAAKTTSRNIALLPVTGRSMEPTYKSGDTLIVDRSVMTFDRDAVFVFRSTAGLFVKRVTILVTGGVIISSDNKEYAEQKLAQSELETVEVLGLIVGVWRYKDL